MWNAGVLDEFAHHIGGHVWTSGESGGGLHGHRFQRKQTRGRMFPTRWWAGGLLPHTEAVVSSEATGAVLRESDFRAGMIAPGRKLTRRFGQTRPA